MPQLVADIVIPQTVKYLRLRTCIQCYIHMHHLVCPRAYYVFRCL